MPTYEFRCPQGHEFEKFYRSISGAEANAACPLCGEISERMMSATGFAFKGSGFYLTDYGKNAHREKGTPTPASPAPSGEGGSKGDSSGSKGDGAKSESSTKSDSGTGGSSSGGSSSAGNDSPPKAAPAADSKPAPAPAKKSTGE